MAYEILGQDGKPKAANDGTIIKASDFTWTDVPSCKYFFVLKEEGDRRIVEVPVSSDLQDRDGDRIKQKGIDPQHAKSVLYAHDWGFGGTMPLGKIVGRTIKEITGGSVTVESHEFPPVGKHDLSDTAWNLIEFGALRATSIGFIPKKVTFAEDDETRQDLGLGSDGVLYVEIEQLETSWVPVQANREAITEALGKGLIPRDVLCKMFPETWLKEIEPPKHWFVGAEIKGDKTDTLLTDLLTIVKDIAVKLTNQETAIKGLQESGGTQPGTIEIEEGVISEALTALEKKPDEVDLEGLLTVLNDAVDAKLKSVTAVTAKTILNQSLGIVDPANLTFTKRT